MRPQEKKNPGAGRRTGAVGVNLRCNRYIHDNRFFLKFQALIDRALHELEAAHV